MTTDSPLKTTDPEPTVLDWFLSVLRLRPIPIPDAPVAEISPAPINVAVPIKSPEPAERMQVSVRAVHLRTPVALLLAFFGQAGLARHESVWLSVGVYMTAAALVGWGVWAGDYGEIQRIHAQGRPATWVFSRNYLIVGLAFAVLSYLTSSDNTFTFVTVLFWIASMLITARAFWTGPVPGTNLAAKIRKFRREPRLKLSISGWSLLVLGTFVLAAFFRFNQLEEVPFEMWSDHAEKYLDIVDVLNGKTSIFFPRNAGREAIQFYATAAAIKWFGLDFSYLTLKTITALAGLITLPFIYLFGKEVGGRGVGLAAMGLAGIAYWPNILSRVGMRLPFFPVFLAPALYFLLRGFRRRSQNDFVISGILVGLALYGYTPARITPLVIGLALALYLLHAVSKGHRRQAVVWVAIAGLLAIVAALPFLHVAYEFQEEVFYRTITRVTDAERPIPGAPLEILASNFWNALRMFSWQFGEIWVLALPFRPALGWVMGALFHLGMVFVGVRYAKSRNWVDLFLLLSIPILLLPSVLALAFPGENPHPSRVGGAIVPVFAIAAIMLVGIWSWTHMKFRAPWNRRIGIGLVGGLFALSALVNYRLVFSDYGAMQRRGAWNTTEAGAVAGGFASSVGFHNNIHMVAYPHWMDSRLVALIAGRPGQDYGLWPEQIDELPDTNSPRLFLLHPDDEENLTRLRRKFPDGSLNRHKSEVQGRDFLIYLIPGQGEDA